MLTNLAGQYQMASAGWMTAALAYALYLFYLLVAIEIAVFAIYALFQKETLVDFVVALLIKMLAILFFYVLLQRAPQWIPSIINSFSRAGSSISGVTTLDPSSVFAQGIMVADKALQGINDASIFSALLLIIVAGLSALIVVIAYTIVAGQLLLTLVESYIVIGGGCLMIGFAGSRWTLIFTERYFGYLVSVGIKLFVLYLIIGLGSTLAPQWAAAFTTAQASALPDPLVYFEVMGGAVVFMILSWQIPSLAGAMMAGSPSLTLGHSATTALTTAAFAMTALNKTLAAISNKPASQALTEAAKVGAAEIKPYGSSKGGMDLPTIQPHQGGLNTISPNPPSAAGPTRRSPTDPGKPKPTAGTIVVPHLPDDRAHGASISPRLNLPE